MRGMSKLGSQNADQKAVGGFLEAMLAIMVVTCGVFLLSSSVLLFGSGFQNNAHDQMMEDICEDLMTSILEDEAIMIGDSLIDFQQIQSLPEECINRTEDLQGALVLLLDLNGGMTYHLLESGEEWKERQPRYLHTQPVNIQFSSLDIHPALLTVVVW